METKEKSEYEVNSSFENLQREIVVRSVHRHFGNFERAFAIGVGGNNPHRCREFRRVAEKRVRDENQGAQETKTEPSNRGHRKPRGNGYRNL